MMSTHVAIDIGGSGVRGILARCNNCEISLTELGQYANDPININGILHWDIQKIINSVKHILKKAYETGEQIDSLAFDTMGLAFVLLDENMNLLIPPVYTRAAQDKKKIDKILHDFGAQNLYERTGLEQRKLNTLYFLRELQINAPHILRLTKHFMMLPDYLNYLLTGIVASEHTIASTSNLLDIKTSTWSECILSYLELSPEIFPEIHKPITVLGRINNDEFKQNSRSDILVVHCASHDTASALFSIQNEHQNAVFISSGTWGMLGCYLEAPILTPQARRRNFANEAAVNGVKFLHNAPGMSMLKKCLEERKAKDVSFDWSNLFDEAKNAPYMGVVIDIHDAGFKNAENMHAKIREYCMEHMHHTPRDDGEIYQLMIESLVQCYKNAYDDLLLSVGKEFEYAVIVGGSVKSDYFLERLSGAMKLPLKIGSEYATVLGNVKAQQMALK